MINHDNRSLMSFNHFASQGYKIIARDSVSEADVDGQQAQLMASISVLYSAASHIDQKMAETASHKPKENVPLKVNRFLFECAKRLRQRIKEEFRKDLAFSEMPGTKLQFSALVSVMARECGELRVANLKPSTQETYRKKYWPSGYPQLRWQQGARETWEYYERCFPEYCEAMKRYIDSLR